MMGGQDKSEVLTSENYQKAKDGYPHYYKEVIPGVWIDVYQVLRAFDTGDPALDHAIKKLLVPGKRGEKTSIKDRKEAIISITRSIELDELWGTP